MIWGIIIWLGLSYSVCAIVYVYYLCNKLEKQLAKYDDIMDTAKELGLDELTDKQMADGFKRILNECDRDTGCDCKTK